MTAQRRQPRQKPSSGRPKTGEGLSRPRAPRRRSRRARRPSRPPAHRTLHLVDVENLSEGPFTGLAVDALAGYLAASEWTKGDHVVVAGHPGSVLEAGLVIGVPCRLVPAHGPDGGDLALLAAASDVEFVMAHYDKVVIGSGDGVFAGLAEQLDSRGLEVWVVAPSKGLSVRLGAMGRRVVTLADPRKASA